MKFITLLFICVFSINPNARLEHALYISVLEIQEGAGEISVMIKLFEDDFRDALRVAYGERLDTVSMTDSIIVTSYFEDNLRLKSSDDLIDLRLHLIERVGDSYRIFFKGKISSTGQLNWVSASYLMEVFPDQKNILHYSREGKKQFRTFDVRTPEAVID